MAEFPHCEQCGAEMQWTGKVWYCPVGHDTPASEPTPSEAAFIAQGFTKVYSQVELDARVAEAVSNAYEDAACRVSRIGERLAKARDEMDEDSPEAYATQTALEMVSIDLERSMLFASEQAQMGKQFEQLKYGDDGAAIRARGTE